MYTVDDQNQVVKLQGVPKASVGAPLPFVVSGEYTTILTYYIENTPDNLKGVSVRIRDTDPEGELVAVVQFSHCLSHLLGLPDEATLHTHPLTQYGLEANEIYVIENSPWVHQFKHINTTHPYFSSVFLDLKHFVFTFHDSTFECVAENFDVWLHRGPIRNVVPHMMKLLEHKQN